MTDQKQIVEEVRWYVPEIAILDDQQPALAGIERALHGFSDVFSGVIVNDVGRVEKRRLWRTVGKGDLVGNVELPGNTPGLTEDVPGRVTGRQGNGGHEDGDPYGDRAERKPVADRIATSSLLRVTATQVQRDGTIGAI